MKLEWLPNEVFLDLFEFFDPIQLIRTFKGLNVRFDRLLFMYFRTYHLDFRSISKSNFHHMCEEYLPLIIDHVSALCLSNDEQTPQLLVHLIRYCLTIDEFTHLRSLLLENIDSSDTLLSITSDCFYLHYLTHLKIIECDITYPKQLIMNIWHLFHLTHCILNVTFSGSLTFIGLPVISKSIEYLSIKNFTFSSMELAHLLSSTPSLQYLCITFGEAIGTELHRIFPAPLVTSLKLTFDGSLSALTNILQSMPSLIHFKFETGTINLNGNQWKEILIQYIPKIKIFRFLMKVFSFKHNNLEEQLEDFLNTFRTPFWLNDHKWFVRCDWPQHSNKIIDGRKQLDADDYNSYDRVMNVYYKGCINNLVLSPRSYPNIRRLTLRLPFDKHFWTIIPTLDHLTSLKVVEMREHNLSESQLKNLLNRTPRLEFLSIDAKSFVQLAILTITHPSLRRLELKHYHNRMNRYMNATQCSILSNSLLGRQCEVLKIRVENRTIILDLINSMDNLRALSFACHDDNWTINSLLSPKDELVEWLQNSLPQTYSVSRHQSRFIRLWINR